MSVTVEKPPVTTNPFLAPRTVHNTRRRVSNSLIIIFAVLATAFAVAVLLFLLLYVVHAGLPNINLDLFTQIPTANGAPGGGMANGIQGSLILVGLASLLGVPLGLFTGIYLSEFGRGPIAMGVRFLVDVLTGIPTIIFGLFAWIFVVVPQQTFSGLAGGVALGIIMIPIVARTSEEVLHLVPEELREASLALGATESRTILRVVIPAARNGIITGVVLAMARVAGETAPLLMTAFGNPFFNSDITQPMDALPLRIFNFAESPYQAQINQSYAGSLVLIVLIVLTSFAIRWATGGFQRDGRR
ncbi:MAG TPA: phosphate ABC transporter permease PstA [Ktedonobacteraceae bacterium]|jgi:phosphate transport system permease protein|nr:phosphate ABC transporter permease PstA [Ktedonobacteraceae bacterium]